MKGKAVWLARWGLLAAGTGFIVLGLLREEHLDVLEKAVRVCLECIGIG